MNNRTKNEIRRLRQSYIDSTFGKEVMMAEQEKAELELAFTHGEIERLKEELIQARKDAASHLENEKMRKAWWDNAPEIIDNELRALENNRETTN